MREPGVDHPLAVARDDVASARRAARENDRHRRTQYARSAVDAATEALLDPDAAPREVVAARRLLRAGLELDDRSGVHPTGIDAVSDTELNDADRRWLENYLDDRPVRIDPPRDRCLER